ncbi:hypothetical protein [Nannocystis radixulma]|uniref:Roadblock/LAMTOR2 domain-containing protein n=1 Tax=Nannocystis radixulma TaxID=2995305 RepID=A0ABT5B292_9BACT|nr:hypothetical protein [Nannocystis radixulma]MDC0668224.1 hypothetical protein [Nannocystis radixulma]
MPGVESQLTALLGGMNSRGGYPLSLVCTDQGLLVAAAGEPARRDVAAGLTGLFDDIVTRAVRDLGLAGVDELTLCEPDSDRLVIRPLARDCVPRLFLVVLVPGGRTWRRHTNHITRKLLALLGPWLTRDAAPPEPP